jgi:hypothetical protein
MSAAAAAFLGCGNGHSRLSVPLALSSQIVYQPFVANLIFGGGATLRSGLKGGDP